MPNDRLRLGAAIFVALALAALTLIGVAKGVTERAKDYHVYDRAGDRWRAGEDLYRDSDIPMPFKYPPPSAALLAPLSALPRPAGGALLNLLSVGALAYALRRLTSDPRAAAITIACLCQSLFLVLDHGQVDLLILGLAVIAWGSRSAVLSGTAWTVACLLKPPAGLLLFGWLRERRPAVVLWAIGAGLVPLLVTAIHYGPASTAELFLNWRSLLGATTGEWFLRHDAQGWPTLLLTPFFPFGGVPKSSLVVLAQLVSLAVFLALYLWKRPSGRAAFALLTLGVALLSPQAWRANFVMALPALVYAGELALSGSRYAVCVLIAVFAVQVVLSEGMLPDVYLDPALAAARPFGLSFSLLVPLLLSPSDENTMRGSAMSRAPLR